MSNLHVVHHGMAGYLPQHSLAFANRRAAERYAADLVRELRAAGERWTGSARDGWYECIAPHSLWYVSIASESCMNQAERNTVIAEINSGY